MPVNPLLRPVCLLLSLGSIVSAELPRSVEVSAQVAALRLAGDEGSLGNAAAYGASVTVPLTPKWAVDVSFLTSRLDPWEDPTHYHAVRRTLLSPAIVRRFGNPRVYGFAGAGIGLESDATHIRWPYFSGDPPLQQGISESKYRNNGATLVVKGGVVWNPVSRLLVRGDIEAACRYVLPSVGARIGIGWRF